MKNILACAALAVSFVAPAAVQAQALPAPVIAVVDLERVTGQCNACKVAAATLRSQVNAVQAREKTLGAPLQAEQKAIQAAIDALKGAAPDSALQARIRAFQTKQQSGADELSRQQQQFKNNQAYVQKQIQDKIGPVYTQTMQKRGANVLLEVSSTLAAAGSLDVTADVLAGLNAALPSIATTAPATAAPSTQGR
ncbi:MAG: OmpH family outer membrane protein [Sphingomicrobium sp.]